MSYRDFPKKMSWHTFRHTFSTLLKGQWHPLLRRSLNPRRRPLARPTANSLTGAADGITQQRQPGTTEPSGLDQVLCRVGRTEKSCDESGEVRKSHDGRGDIEYPHGHF